MEDIKKISVDGVEADINVLDGKLTLAQLSSPLQDLVTDGYKFMGEIPSLSYEATADYATVWIATLAGTYDNFDGLKLSANQGAIVWGDGTGMWEWWVFNSFSDEERDKIPELQSEVTKVGIKVEEIKPIVVENHGVINNAADEEDFTATSDGLLKIKDRSSLDGMGYVILRKNKTFAEQVTEENTIYEIRYDFNLGGTPVAIPDGCTLKFVGGKLYNGKLLCNYSCIDATLTTIFGNDMIFEGSFVNKEFPIEWFGASISNNDNTPYINQAISAISEMNHNGATLLITGLYQVKDSIILKNRISIRGVHFSDKQNSGDTAAPEGNYIASGFEYNFDSPNKWVIDEWRNNELRPYNELFRDNSDVPNWGYVRKCATCISNIAIIQGSNSKVAFGGIRLSNSYNTKFENIHIAATFVGFCLNYVGGTFVNINCYCKVGFYFGWNSTTPILYNCFVNGRLAWVENDIEFNLGECIFRDKNKLFPPYCEIRSAAFIAEGSDSDLTSPSLVCGGCQYVDAALIAGARAQFKVSNIYLEGHYNTIMWAYEGKSSIVGDCGDFLLNQGTFVFGTQVGFIYAKDIRLSTCYINSDAEASYVIDNSVGNYLYYDGYEIEGNTVLNLVKSPNKTIVPYGDVKINAQNNYDYPEHPEWIRALRDVYTGTEGKLLALRDDIKSANICVVDNGTGFDSETKIINKDYRLYHNGTSSFVVQFNDVYVENSSILVENMLASNRAGGSKCFRVSGKCRIELKSYVIPDTCKVELVGDNPIDLTLIVDNDNLVSDFITNLDTCTTKYVVHYSGRDGFGKKTVTNTIRPINGNTIGDVFIENGKPIYWNGTKWVDATGADV